MIAFVDDNRGTHRVEPICKVLPIAPSTYHARVRQRRDPSLLSARAQRDLTLKLEVQRVFDANFGVYGVRKVWRQMRREGFDIARCTVERLMRQMGLADIIHRRGPWRSFEAVEYATLEWIDWFNNRRLLESIGNIPPAEAEARYDAMLDEFPMAA
jgi:transposase InsO family protein